MISQPVDPKTETPLDRSIVGKAKPSYESGAATFPAKVYPNIEEGIRRSRTGNWVVDVILRDPQTNREIILEGIILEQASQGIIQKINKQGIVYVSMPDQRLLAERDTSSMTARWLNTNVGTENGAVPLDMLYSAFRNKITSAANRICITEKFDFNKAKKDIHKTNGITVYADETNPNSSGIIVDSTTGESAIFNQYGENIVLGKKGVSIDAKNFNRGTSSQTKQGLGTLGLPGKENEVQDIMPRSNILLNVPMIQMPYWPQFMQILYGVVFLYKIIRVGQVAADFIQGNRYSDEIDRERDEMKRKQQEESLNFIGSSPRVSSVIPDSITNIISPGT